MGYGYGAYGAGYGFAAEGVGAGAAPPVPISAVAADGWQATMIAPADLALRRGTRPPPGL